MNSFGNSFGNSFVNLKKRVLFSQLKIGETYYESYTESRDKFVGFDGYLAIFEEHIFFAYKKCKFYELIPFKDIVQQYQSSLNDVSVDETKDKIENLLDMNITMSALDRQLFF
jgi:hypothetical protein